MICVALDLGAQPLNVDVHQSGVRRMSITPDFLEQHLAREHLPRAACQTGEEVELEWGECNGLLATPDNMSGDIDLQIANAQLLDQRLRRRAKTGTQTSNQLLGFERLVDVVIRAVLQSGNNVHRVRTSSQHDDRDTGFGPNAPTHFNSVASRKHDIQQHDVGLALPKHGQGLIPVSAKNGFEALSAKDNAEHLGKRCVIIDYQDPIGHGDILSPHHQLRHAGGSMTIPAEPLRIGQLLVHTFRFMRTHPSSTLGIGALLATVSSIVSGIVLNIGARWQEILDDILANSGQPVSDSTLADVEQALTTALPWFIALLVVSFLVQLAATGVMTSAVVRARRELPIVPAELWRSVPWLQLIAVNGLTFALMALVAIIPIAFAVLLGLPALLAVAVAAIAAIAVAITTALAVPALIGEQIGATAAVRRSVELVRGGWWATAAALLVANFLWSTAGSVVAAPVSALAGALAGGSRSPSGQALASLLSGITTGAIALPGIAIMTTLIYFNRRGDQ